MSTALSCEVCREASIEIGSGFTRAKAKRKRASVIVAVVQLYSYPGQYLREQPSIDRIAETILKLEEDVLGQGTYPSPRDAVLRFGDPVDVNRFLEERSLDSKTGVSPITRHISEQIQSMLESICL